MTAFPNLHALAYGEGGQRLSAELRVEAADALEQIKRLEWWKRDALASLNNWHALEDTVPAEFAAPRLGWTWPRIIAAYIESITPAHDKEKP